VRGLVEGCWDGGGGVGGGGVVCGVWLCVCVCVWVCVLCCGGCVGVGGLGVVGIKSQRLRPRSASLGQLPRFRVEAMDSATLLLRTGARTLKPSIVIDRTHSLGSGAFGTVYAAAGRDGERLAVKVVDAAGLSQKARQQLLREVMLHTSMDYHAHILRCLGAYESKSGDAVTLVLDRCAGDVGTAMQGEAAAVATLARRFVGQLLRALDHLHARSIAHCTPHRIDTRTSTAAAAVAHSSRPSCVPCANRRRQAKQPAALA
jgi:hypothetical protein